MPSCRTCVVISELLWTKKHVRLKDYDMFLWSRRQFLERASLLRRGLDGGSGVGSTQRQFCGTGHTWEILLNIWIKAYYQDQYSRLTDKYSLTINIILICFSQIHGHPGQRSIPLQACGANVRQVWFPVVVVTYHNAGAGCLHVSACFCPSVYNIHRNFRQVFLDSFTDTATLWRHTRR